MDGYGELALATASFVGGHLILSHPLRAPLVKALGAIGFQILYAVAAFASLWWISRAWKAAPGAAPLWAVGDSLWAFASVIMLIASVLLMGSLIGNPAFPAPNVKAPAEARGVYAITRHPMLWSFALWGIAHMLVFPIPAQFIVAGGFTAFALIGAAALDAKKARLNPDLWRPWVAMTSYWPFQAIGQGRARFGGFRPHDLAGGLVIWLGATRAHQPAAGIAAGIWRWIG
ncbi:MAG: NnrU family protein [Sphingomonas sp.]|uniref:NnrU family protein n=1 Tax=Sphingomonas sp. TaxID=28214 RepID=UPI0025E51685|nr:NnrU family protein [Sphingomonas sp.]MBX9881366.1 NnrU family protein [Sphingomonas sp.]